MNLRVLILACGNTLRSDDGIGPWLAAWAEERFAADSRVKVISRQQWTPDLAEDIANASSVLFIDCSVASEPGTVSLLLIEPADAQQGLATHHQDAPKLLALTQELFGILPAHTSLLTIGAGSTELGETFSEPVRNAIPTACSALEDRVAAFLSGDHQKR
jgi:hydrogenase maturation protease